MINHDKGKALLMRFVDLQAQAAEIRKEQTEIKLQIKDYLYQQNTRKLILGGFRVNMRPTTSYSFSKIKLVEKYGPDVLYCASRSDSFTLEVSEVKSL